MREEKNQRVEEVSCLFRGWFKVRLLGLSLLGTGTLPVQVSSRYSSLHAPYEGSHVLNWDEPLHFITEMFQGSNLTPLALEGKVLTIGPPGSSSAFQGEGSKNNLQRSF
ncbi:hypothetical protein CapIbe_010123 [Capra ibex]